MDNSQMYIFLVKIKTAEVIEMPVKVIFYVCHIKIFKN